MDYVCDMSMQYWPEKLWKQISERIILWAVGVVLTYEFEEPLHRQLLERCQYFSNKLIGHILFVWVVGSVAVYWCWHPKLEEINCSRDHLDSLTTLLYWSHHTNHIVWCFQVKFHRDGTWKWLRILISIGDWIFRWTVRPCRWSPRIWIIRLNMDRDCITL